MKVSIIIPAFNAENTISKSILSVLNQSYKDIELIIINDGSTDSTLTIIENFRKNDNRIKILDGRNNGVSVARNSGIDKSTGEYLMFLDADDYLESEAIEVLLKTILKYDTDMVSASFKRVNKFEQEPEKTLLREGYFDKNDLKKEIYPYILATKSLKDYIPLTFCTKLYSSNFIKDNKIKFLPSLKVAEDNLFSLTCFLNAESFYYLPNFKAYNYVKNSESVTNSYITNCWKNLKRFFKEIEKLSSTFYFYNLNEQLPYALLRCAMTAIANESSNPNNKKIIRNELIKVIKDDDIQKSLTIVSTEKMNFLRKIILYFLENGNVNSLYLFIKFKRFLNRIDNAK